VKTIGIVGGIGPESTIDYYRLLLARAHELGGVKSAQVVINSVDYWELRRLLDVGHVAGSIDHYERRSHLTSDGL